MILVTGGAMTQILLFSALAFVIVAALDFMFQRKQHTKSLMMTKEEVKREFKESEGDPIIKGKRKQLAQELAMSDGAERTRKATAVVVNPTHFAVAIDYQPDITPLPVVVAKGRNLYAHHLRMQAEEAGVPIFRNVPLARGLYAETEVDEYVPDELFDAVAEILVWVSHNKGQLYQGRLEFGDLDMELGDHKISDARPAAKPGFSFDS
jgi:type III secretion protein U